MRHQQDTPEAWSEDEMILRRLYIGPKSPFLGKTIVESAIRERYHCLVAGVEKADGSLHVPNASIPFEEGDVLWLVGEHSDIETVMAL